MRKALMVMAALMLGMPVFADDAVNEHKSTVDTSTNPITGTKTTTKKYKSRKKNADGSNAKVDHKDTTKVKTDGTVEHKTETSNSAETPTK